MRDINSFVEAGVIGQFPGGIYPPERKQPANQVALRRLPLPDELILPLRQHIGPSGQCLVKAGDTVLKGQQLTEAVLSQGLPLHAPTSGIVSAVEERPTAHASGLPELAIVITPDGEERWQKLPPLADYRQSDKATLLERVQSAGIAGLGGAGFPTAQKLARQKPIEYLIINGVECEPYICADDRLMREKADEIVSGMQILQFISSAQRIILAIEDNKPEAIEAMKAAVQGIDDIILRVVPTKYPSGGEKQLIQMLTGEQVPHQQLPLDMGLIMQNTGTAYAVKRAVIDGEPLLERVVTLTGKQMQKPGNVWALLGTPVEHLLTAGEYQATDQPRIIAGGPMMGFTLPSLKVPVIKTTNCILTPSQQELPESGPEMACIRCGACADVCPASLQPQQLQWLAKAKNYDDLEQQDLFDCIECGACAYVCPSEIPLVHYYRKAKAEIRNIARDKAKAELARQRFEDRQQRLEREKQEREERHRKAAEARKKAQQQSKASTSSTGSDDQPAQDKSSAVAAAIARAKAKKAAQQQQADNEDNKS